MTSKFTVYNPNLKIENERFDVEQDSPNDEVCGIYYQSFITVLTSKNFEDMFRMPSYTILSLKIRMVLVLYFLQPKGFCIKITYCGLLIQISIFEWLKAFILILGAAKKVIWRKKRRFFTA
jgi:hypothetical protein